MQISISTTNVQHYSYRHVCVTTSGTATDEISLPPVKLLHKTLLFNSRYIATSDSVTL